MDTHVEMTRDRLIDMYKKMLEIRLFEEKVEELLGNRTIKGTAHLYIGEEAIAVGACAALNPDDYITSTHRGHGHCIAKGGRLDKMMAELWGKTTGYCKGKGGSMHIADIESGNLGANGIVGAGIPIATGAGLSIKLRKTNQVVLCFFGDGATNQGSFHESLNFAGIWRLPVIYICENNLYGISMHISNAVAIEDLAERGDSYGIPGVAVDGNDVMAVYEATREAVARARCGEGAAMIECKTYRWRGHSRSDPRVYRTREEEDAWKKSCPIKRFKDYLLRTGTANENEVLAVEQDVVREIEDAVRYAESSPYPTEDEILEDVYSNPV